MVVSRRVDIFEMDAKYTTNRRKLLRQPWRGGGRFRKSAWFELPATRKHRVQVFIDVSSCLDPFPLVEQIAKPSLRGEGGYSVPYHMYPTRMKLEPRS